MKKFVLLAILIVGLTVPSVFSWDAARTISGNDATITIDTTGTTGYIITETIPVGLSVTSAQNCITAANYCPDNEGYISPEASDSIDAGTEGYIRWTFTGNTYDQLTYSTAGSGTVSGSMAAGPPPASEEDILPATSDIPTTTCTTTEDCLDSACVGATVTSPVTLQTVTCCQDDSVCSGTDFCQNNICEAAGTCTSDAHCTIPGQTCVSGTCAVDHLTTLLGEIDTILKNTSLSRLKQITDIALALKEYFAAITTS